jgi:hypothetical protein
MDTAAAAAPVIPANPAAKTDYHAHYVRLGTARPGSEGCHAARARGTSLVGCDGARGACPGSTFVWICPLGGSARDIRGVGHGLHSQTCEPGRSRHRPQPPVRPPCRFLPAR